MSNNQFTNSLAPQSRPTDSINTKQLQKPTINHYQLIGTNFEITPLAKAVQAIRDEGGPDTAENNRVRDYMKNGVERTHKNKRAKNY